MEVLTELDRGRIEALVARDEFFWLDLMDPTPPGLDELGTLLGLHPLAMEDSREFGQRAKVDRYGHAVLIVFYSARVPDHGRGVALLEVHLHVTGGFLVTVRRSACAELEKLHETLVPENTEAEDYLVYRVLDGLTDALYPVADHFEARIDALEGEVLAEAEPRLLGEIYRLKQDVQQLLRRLIPQRDLFGAATEALQSLPGLTHGSRAYMRDVGDHLAQISSELHRQTDDLGALTATYFNANQNRLNQTATRLTVIATFFLIWTLATSFFGQNFKWMTDHIESLHAFVIWDMGALIIPTLVAAVYFWRRRDEWWR